jgi:hypothetical protein
MFQAAGDWDNWRKPKSCQYIWIDVIQPAAGGGGGFTGAAASARGGGGGGGSGCIGHFLFPAWALPDILAVFVGAGGLGGAATLAGAAGGVSWVGVRADATGNYNYAAHLASSGALGGGAGTGAAGGAAGAGAAQNVSNGTFLAGCLLRQLGGAAGAAGGSPAGAVGASITLPTSPLTGGAGGAGTTSADFAGGGFSATGGDVLVSDYRPGTGAAGSVAGGSGYPLWPPSAGFISYGGCGGSSSNAGVGGAGGTGGVGSGGGGGGGGTTGGRGGDGGAGLIIIAWL